MEQVNNFRIFDSKEHNGKAICYYHNAELLGAELTHKNAIYPVKFSNNENDIQWFIDVHDLSCGHASIKIPSQLLNPIN